MDLLSLLSGGSLAGADGPDRLVGNHDILPLLGCEVEYAACQFGLAHSLLLVGLALCQALADAENDLQTIGQCQVHLLLQYLGSLGIVLTTLAVAQYHVLSTGALHHSCAHFTGIGTALVVGTVLGAHGDHAVFEQLANGSQVDEGCADDNLAVGLLGSQNVLQLGGQRHTFLQVLVHLPVACYNLLSHNAFI